MQLDETKAYRATVVLVVLTACTHALSYYLRIAIFKVPPYRFPYWWSICGSILMCALPIGMYKQGAMRFALVFAATSAVIGLIMCYGDLSYGALPRP
jgi:hypothetical protein